MRIFNINLFYVFLVLTFIINCALGFFQSKDKNKKCRTKTDLHFSLPESEYESKKYYINDDYVFSLPKNKKKILIEKEKKNSMYYVFSLFCFEYRFNQSKLGIVEFGDRIFGETGESKFLQVFMPSVSVKGKNFRTFNFYSVYKIN
jgi:hypothetical protein